MQVKGVFQTYATISLNDLSKIDFSQIGETSEDTIRKNVLDPPTQFVIKWILSLRLLRMVQLYLTACTPMRSV